MKSFQSNILNVFVLVTHFLHQAFIRMWGKGLICLHFSYPPKLNLMLLALLIKTNAYCACHQKSLQLVVPTDEYY